jgi:Protein of unknown function (DUF2281)
MENISLYNKLASLPDQMKLEVDRFMDLLITKAKADKKDNDRPKPKFGSGKGMFIMGPDFDEPLEDFKEYMY